MTLLAKPDVFAMFKTRHSVRHFDPGYRLERQEISNLLEMANTAPSAWNIQPWKFLAFSDPSAQAKLLPIADGQRQVVEASAVVAVLGDLRADRDAEAVLGDAVRAGLMPEELKESWVKDVESAYASYPELSRDQAFRGASMAAMQLMLAAKAAGLDSCPLGGFDAAGLSETFRIPSRYVPVLLVAIGKAAAPARPSYRRPVEQTVVWNGF
ncbi:nitroreductase family protein [Cohnella caldifontis]|uniref:nitroreductase family protein n=1 Tax=Cohnella caldifontis TaxID=3027471 RepID=UPI0023ED170A|nr:nitroreductase family protein [Cohnella sp. YIM B05605]